MPRGQDNTHILLPRPPREAWKAKGPKHQGANLDDLLATLREKRRSIKGATQLVPLKDLEKEAGRIIAEMLHGAATAVKDSDRRREHLGDWMQRSDLVPPGLRI